MSELKPVLTELTEREADEVTGGLRWEEMRQSDNVINCADYATFYNLMDSHTGFYEGISNSTWELLDSFGGAGRSGFVGTAMVCSAV